MTGELDGAGVADGQAADGLPAEGQPAASIDGSFVAVAKPSVASVELDGEGVLYDEEAGASHLLNATATAVWSCLDGSGTLDEIAAELADAFGADAQTVRHDVIALVQQFGRQGLLVGIAAEPPAEA
ncbi:MAG: HPr-rel-A system PqqD family peptide chaperone, partial [Acidimicrobiales bacterium]